MMLKSACKVKSACKALCAIFEWNDSKTFQNCSLDLWRDKWSQQTIYKSHVMSFVKLISIFLMFLTLFLDFINSLHVIFYKSSYSLWTYPSPKCLLIKLLLPILCNFSEQFCFFKLQLEQKILDFCEGLRVIGVKPDEKLALFADNSCRWLVADQGIAEIIFNIAA